MNDLAAHLDRAIRALARVAAGDEQADAHLDRLAEGRTLRQVASDADVAVSTLHKRLQRARGVLIANGLLPESWRSRPTGPRVVPRIGNNPRHV